MNPVQPKPTEPNIFLAQLTEHLNLLKKFFTEVPEPTKKRTGSVVWNN